MKTNINELNLLKSKFKTATNTSDSALSSMTRTVKSTIQEVRSSYSNLNYTCANITQQVERISKLQQKLVGELEATTRALEWAVKAYHQSEKEEMSLIGQTGLSKVAMSSKTASYSLGKVAALSSLQLLQNIGVTIEETECESEKEIDLEDAISTGKDWTDIIGNVLEGVGPSSSQFSKLFKDGLRVINNGKYIKIKCSPELRKLLQLPKDVKVNSVLRAGADSDIWKNINKAFKIEKLAKYIKASKIEKVAKGIDKAAPWITRVGVVLDVGGGIYDNIQKGAEGTEIVGDAIGDTAVAAGGVWVGSIGAGKGAAAGAAIGTAICPGIGTAIGAGVGALGGALASGWLYEKITEIEIEGKSIHEWINTAATDICEGVTDAAKGLYNGAKDFVGDVGDALSDGWDNICGLFN